MGSKRYFNAQHASPSYEEMEQSKPKNNNPRYRPPMPIRYVSCFKCHKTGGTLVKSENPKTKKEDFIHPECLEVK